MFKWIFRLFKLTLFAFNSLYFLVAIVLLIGAAFVHLNANQLNDLLKLEYENEYGELMLFAMCTTVLLLVVGFIGCVGILGETSWLLLIYFALLFMIFGLQFTGAVYLYVKSAGLFGSFGERMRHAIRHSYGSSVVHSRAIDYLHYKLKCCGWQSPNDWNESTYVDPKYVFRPHENVITASPSFTFKIPHSCCVNNYDLTCVLMHKFHEVGCEHIVKSYFQQLEMYVAWTLAFLNLYQLVLLVLALYLICMIMLDKRADAAAAATEAYADGTRACNTANTSFMDAACAVESADESSTNVPKYYL